MKRMIAMLLTTVFLISAGTSAYANDVSESKTEGERILEQMENIGFWEKEDVSVTRSATVYEYTRFDGERSLVEISESDGNEVITFRSEGKENSLILTPDGETYIDQVSEENKITVTVETTSAVEPRVTTETWMSRATPYDNGPYTYNRNMTRNLNIDVNKAIGDVVFDALIGILVPEVTALKYYKGASDVKGEFDDLCTLIKILQGELPFSECVYVQEKYYNGDSDTSGRPLEYCYQVWTRVAKSSSFNKFIESVNGLNVQISYAKQLIYA